MSVEARTIEIASVNGALVYDPDDGVSVLLSNQDQNNTIYLATNDPSVAPGQNQSLNIPLAPGGFIVIDGPIPYYAAIPQGQSALLAVIPGASAYFQFVTILTKIIEISATAGNGLFVYNPAPALGALVAAMTPVAGTDPKGNIVPAGFNFGMWDAGGHLRQHFGISDVGDLFLANSAGNTILFIAASTGQMTFFNDFGAAVMVIAPHIGGLFFYNDNGSATQGATIGANVWHTTAINDPVNNTTFNPGLTSIDPVFGDFQRAVGSLIQLGQVPSTFVGQITAPGGTTAPALQIDANEQGGTSPKHPQILMLGTTNTRIAQIIVGLVAGNANPLTPQTSALLEVQGDLTANSIQAIVGGVTEPWHTITIFPAGWTGTVWYKHLTEKNIVGMQWELQASAGTVITLGEHIWAMAAGYFHNGTFSPILHGGYTLGPAFAQDIYAPMQIDNGGNVTWVQPGLTVPAGNTLFWQGYVEWPIDI